MADVAHEENVIEQDERTFIHSIIDFGDTVAREVMMPRPDMVTVEADATVRDALEAALGAGYSRIPVEEDGIDDIVGIAYAKDLMRDERAGRADQPVRDSCARPSSSPSPRRSRTSCARCRRRSSTWPIVVDEYGGRPDWSPSRTSSRSSWATSSTSSTSRSRRSSAAPTARSLVSALYSVDDADELLGAELPHGPWDTVGGLMLDLVGRVPNTGDSVEVDGSASRPSTCGGGASAGTDRARPTGPAPPRTAS